MKSKKNDEVMEHLLAVDPSLDQRRRWRRMKSKKKEVTR
jgi:hypothetical protein